MTRDLKSWALHPGSLRERVAMEMNETVYSALMWLSSRGSGQVMKPRASPFFLTPPPHRVPTGSALGLAGNLTSVLPGPAHHNPLGLIPHVC